MPRNNHPWWDNFFIYTGVSDSIAGQGTLVTAPDPFYGYSQVDATGIVIDQLNFDFDPDLQEAPFAFTVYPSISVSGNVRLSSGTIRPKLHCHTVYTLTYADDSAIAHDSELVYKYDNTTIDPYTGLFGNVAGFILRDQGDYKLVVDVYVMTSTGQARKATSTYEFSLSDYSGTKKFYDATNGNTLNDGNDPLGIGLTNASYTHATGVLSETNAFTAYTHSGSTYKLNSPDWIYLDGYGLVYIESKTDASNVVIHADWRDVIGSDQTGLTSSSGAKAATDFAALQLNTSTQNNTLYMLSGQNSDVYDKTNELLVTSCTGTVGAVAYGGNATMRFSTGATSNFIAHLDQSFSNANSPDQFILSDITLDGQSHVGCLEYNMDGTNAVSDLKAINDRLTILNNGDDAGINQAESNGTRQPFYYYQYAGYIDNTRVNAETPTLSAAITAGDTSCTITSGLSNSRTSLWMKIEEGGTTEYNYVTVSGTTLSLEAKRQYDNQFDNSFTTAATVTLTNRRTMCLNIGKADTVCLIGLGFKADVDNDVYDHLCYPKYYDSNHILFGCYVDLDASGDNRASFMWNHNTNDAGGIVDNINCSMNYVAPGATTYFSEGGGGLNAIQSDGYFTNVYMYGNAGAPKAGFIYHFLIVSLFAKASRAWRASSAYDYRGIVDWSVQASNEYWLDYDWYVGMEDNYGYNMPLHINDNDVDAGYHVNDVDAYGNITYITTTADFSLGTEFDSGYTQVYSENTFYAPNDSDGNHIQVAGSTVSLASFNSTAGYTNYESDPGWNDPANGDFSIGTPVADFNESTPTYTTIEDTNASTAYFTNATQYIAKIYFKVTSNAATQRIFDGAASGGYVSSYAQMGFTSSDTLYFGGQVVSVAFDGGSTISSGTDISSYLDGAEHYVEVLIQGLGRVGAVGISASTTAGFSGQLWGLQFIQVSDSSVLADLPMDAVKLDTETEVDGDITMTYVGFVSGDWTTRA